MEYSFDSNAARSGDKTGGKFIDASGAYQGVFTRAEALISKNTGTHGVGFTFKSADDKTVNFDIWTVKGNGEKLSGFDQVQAIMTCLRVRGMKPEPMTATKYDFDARQDKTVQISGFAALVNKPIGVFLQQELSTYDGKDRTKMNLVGSFEANTLLTANEILDKATEPLNYHAKLEWLAKSPVKDNRSKSPKSAPQHANNSGFDEDTDWDSQIPF